MTLSRTMRTVSFIAGFLLLPATWAGQAAPGPRVHVWQRWETTLSSSKSYENPYADVEVRVTFTGSESETLLGRGFWDGARTFKIRCAFPRTGVWTWRTTCSDTANAGLHNRTGSITVGPYTGDNPLYRHGFLKVSANRRHLAFADGKPFLWVGDTAWYGPMRARPEDWEEYLRVRTSQGFTVAQISPCREKAGAADTAGNLPFSGPGLKKWNPPFWQSFEEKVQRANEKGLAILVVGLMEPVGRYPQSGEAQVFARNLVARLFGNFVIFSPSFDSAYSTLGDDVGQAVREATAVHLITQHPNTPSGRPVNVTAEAYYDRPYLDFSGDQSGHNGGNLDRCARQAIEWNLHLYRREPPKPVINIEAMYDSQGEKGWRAEDARSLGYRSWLSGALGYTYGCGETGAKVPKAAGGVWGWNTDPNAFDYWAKAIHWPSAEQMKHLRDFFGAVEWWRLEPAHDLILNQPEAAPRRMVLARSAAGDLAVAYLPDNDEITLNLKSLSPKLTGNWFNPRTGEYAGIRGPIGNETSKTFSRPGPGDWVLLLHEVR